MSRRHDQPLTSRERVLIGGAGALTPLALNLLVVDFAALQTAAFAPPALVGYLVRVVVLFAFGALIAYFHDDESKRVKLYQIGLGVPALAVALLNGRNVKIPDASVALTAQHVFLFEHSAVAQEPHSDGNLKRFSLAVPTGMQAFWQGVTGRPPDAIWFVVAAQYATPEEAKTHAEALKQKGLTADVYHPYGDNKYYSVVVGKHLTRQDAEAVVAKAIALGAPKDTHPWTFPKK